MVASPGVRTVAGVYRLGPGDLCAGGGPDLVLATVLGSCVSACLYDPRTGLGGMNHFLLPRGKATDAGAATRYGTFAMEQLINELMKLGAYRSSLTAKAFGGAAVLRSATDIGGVNSRFLREYLDVEEIPLVAHDLGGSAARRLRFWPATGRVQLRVLEEPERVARRERTHLEALATRPLEGDVELF